MSHGGRTLVDAAVGPPADEGPQLQLLQAHLGAVPQQVLHAQQAHVPCAARPRCVPGRCACMAAPINAFCPGGSSCKASFALHRSQ